MNSEQRYCRKVTSKLFNSLPHTQWIPNLNTTFATGVSSSPYQSGRPDGFVFSGGKVLGIECKAEFGSVFLGDPEDPSKTTGWHYSQRNWWKNCAVPTKTPYFIALWVYPECNPPTVRQERAALYLVPPITWVDLETMSGLKRIPLHNDVRGARKSDYTIERAFSPFALSYTLGWHIPPTHPINAHLS